MTAILPGAVFPSVPGRTEVDPALEPDRGPLQVLRSKPKEPVS